MFAMRISFLTLLLGLPLMLPLAAAAQGWQPTRAIEVVVPFTAGSLADRNIRTAAPLLSRELGVPVAVQNIPGANGYNRIFRAAPDGLTLGVGDPVAQMGLALVQPQPFDVLRLTWLGHWSAGTQTMVLSTRSRFQSLDQMRGATTPVRCWNNSPARWGVVPMPAEAKFSLPGLALP